MPAPELGVGAALCRSAQSRARSISRSALPSCWQRPSCSPVTVSGLRVRRNSSRAVPFSRLNLRWTGAPHCSAPDPQSGPARADLRVSGPGLIQQTLGPFHHRPSGGVAHMINVECSKLVLGSQYIADPVAVLGCGRNSGRIVHPRAGICRACMLLRIARAERRFGPALAVPGQPPNRPLRALQ